MTSAIRADKTDNFAGRHHRRHRRRGPLALIAVLVVVAVAVAVGLWVSDSRGPAGAALPADFPTAVPVVAGQITDESKVGSAWNVTVRLSDARNQAVALQQLRDSGFQVIGQNQNTTEATRVYSLANAQYSIRLAYTTVGSAPAVKYTVAERQPIPATDNLNGITDSGDTPSDAPAPDAPNS